MSQDGKAIDVLVAGAGPAGATIARLLARHGMSVVLVHPGIPAVSRLELLAPAAVGVFEALDLEHLLADEHIAKPCLGIRRKWGNTKSTAEDFLRHPHGRGYAIDRLRFDQALRKAAIEAGAEWVAGGVRRVERHELLTEVHVANTSTVLTLAARIVVDATGRVSAVARRLGLKRVVYERLVAKRRPVDLDGNASGASAWLDVSGHDPSWSYGISGPSAQREEWEVLRGQDRRASAGGWRVDASSASLTRSAAKGFVAVGDAASAFDPITSQGLANAFATAVVAAGMIRSPRGLDEPSARAYSEAVQAAFQNSERGRAAIYASL